MYSASTSLPGGFLGIGDTRGPGPGPGLGLVIGLEVGLAFGLGPVEGLAAELAPGLTLLMSTINLLRNSSAF